jgi:alpha-beta hydrolase superfamily lysophospholipase
MPIVVFGLYLSKLIIAIRGPRHISKLVEFLAFGSYNERFKKENDPNAWLSTDKTVREKYAKDKFCIFPFTVSAMHDLISLTYNANKSEWFKNVAKKTPILLVSGEDDVVGEYGKGVKTVYKKLVQNGADVKMKLYPHNRHEILNDNARDELIEDILNFIK